jgi:hypothetical protein
MEEDDSDVNLIVQGIISSAKSNHIFPFAVSAMLTEVKVSAIKLFFSYRLSLFRILDIKAARPSRSTSISTLHQRDRILPFRAGNYFMLGFSTFLSFLSLLRRDLLASSCCGDYQNHSSSVLRGR